MSVSQALKPFVCHGLDPRLVPGHDAQADCPFCGKPKHFFLNPETGQWDCKVCGRSGNVHTFLREVCIATAKRTTRDQYLELSRDRGIPTGILKDAGVGFDGANWLIPSRGETGAVRDVRRWNKKTRKVMATDGCATQLWNADKLRAAPPGALVLLCEGDWDGLAAEWLIRDDGNSASRGPAVAVAVPGATVFKADWVSLFNDKNVVCLYDHDEAGAAGENKANEAISSCASSIKFVHWPKGSPEGFDTRDFAKRLNSEGLIPSGLDRLLELTNDAPRPLPESMRSRMKPEEKGETKFKSDDLPEMTFDQVIEVFRKHLHLNDDAVMALKICFAVCLSTDMRWKKNPLWLYLVGQPSSGKTELLSSMKASPRTLFVSTVTPHGLVSGWKSGQDPSLIAKLKDKTLVAKDFTEILTMHPSAQAEVFSVLRGAFDGYVDKMFGNGVKRHYSDHYFACIAGATHAIHAKKMSELGERFLKFQLPTVTETEERARNKKARHSVTSGGDQDSGQEMSKASSAFLKQQLPRILPECGDEADEAIGDVATLVSEMRANVTRDERTGDMTHRPVREASTRVYVQLLRLAVILAWMHGRHEVGPEDVAIIRRVGLDTAIGFNLDVLKAMMKLGGSATKQEICDTAGVPIATVGRRIEDLVDLGVVSKMKQTKTKGAGRPAVVYVVTESVARMWRSASQSQEKSDGHGDSRKVVRSAGGAGSSIPREDGMRRTSNGGRPGIARRVVVRKRIAVG